MTILKFDHDVPGLQRKSRNCVLDYAQRIIPSNDSCKQYVCLKPWIREGTAYSVTQTHTAY